MIEDQLSNIEKVRQAEIVLDPEDVLYLILICIH